MKFIRIAVLCLLSAVAVQAQDDNLQLQYHFNTGDRFVLQRKSTQDSYLEIQGITQRTTRQIRDTLLLTVTGVNNGTATLTARFKNIFLLASGDNQQMTINTGAGGNDIFNRVFKKAVDKPFTITMNANGTIQSISGLQEIMDDMKETVARKSAAEKEAFATLLHEQFGPDAMKTSLQQAIPYYPDRSVHTGDSWTSFVNTGGALTGRVDYYWKLDYGDKYSVNISNTGKFSTDKSRTVSLGGNMEGNIDLSGNSQGNYAVDPSTGWPTLSIQHTEVKGNYFYKPNLKMKNGLTVPVRIVTDEQSGILHL